jgi:hypothetical protein
MKEDRMRRHHEELAAVPSIVPALSLLIPFAGALWARIKTAPKKPPNRTRYAEVICERTP